MSIMAFEPMYPDVLGAITGGTRISMEKLQCALGIFPQQTYINQPVEAVLILQNMVDQNMQVKVGVQLPTEDKRGNVVVIDTSKTMLSLGMRPGEVGVVRIPITPHPPTPPGTKYPVRVAVRFRTMGEGKYVRPPSGGAPPSVLAISPVKLQVLRDVEFTAETWGQSTDILTTYFDVLAKKMPRSTTEPKPQYDTLWTHEEMVEERQLVASKASVARQLSISMTRSNIYEPLKEAVADRFGDRGWPLHPGEITAIAKIMTYTMDEGIELEKIFTLEDTRWFQTLCQTLAHDPDVERWNRGDIATQFLFDAVLYDSVIMAFHVIKHKVGEDLGTKSEQASYATNILTWLGGQGTGDLSYIYLPLVLGGVVISRMVANKSENPWTLLQELREARKGRDKLLTGEASVIFNMIDQLISGAEDVLRRDRIPQP